MHRCTQSQVGVVSRTERRVMAARPTNIVPRERPSANLTLYLPHHYALAQRLRANSPHLLAKEIPTATAVKHRILVHLIAQAVQLQLIDLYHFSLRPRKAAAVHQTNPAATLAEIP